MPSPRAVLSDIATKKLDPKKEYRSVSSSNGHIQAFSAKESVTKTDSKKTVTEVITPAEVAPVVLVVEEVQVTVVTPPDVVVDVDATEDTLSTEKPTETLNVVQGFNSSQQRKKAKKTELTQE